MKISEIYVENILRIEKASVSVKSNKLLLFGPNSAGKSSLIYGLLAALRQLGGGIEGQDFEQYTAPWQDLVKRGEGVVRLTVDGVPYRVLFKVGESPKIYRGDELVSAVRLSFRLSYVGPCSLFSPRLKRDFCTDVITIDDPALAEWVRKYLYLIGADDYYYEWIKSDDLWFSVRRLAYGYKRALAVIIAAYSADVLAVEGFESGLHYDLAVDLVDWLSELSDTFVVLESHNGMSVTAALKSGWDVYYVEGGKFTPIRTIDDFSKVATREMEAYARAKSP
ncbi:MAG: hypothetical protein QXP98_07090 [Thermoproteus sp.]